MRVLDQRARDVLYQLVDTYLETRAPVGSLALSKLLSIPLSPATIRNVMVDLEAAGLIEAPHVSAGRRPTEKGLRFMVDMFLEASKVPSFKSRKETPFEIDQHREGDTLEMLFEKATAALSGLSACAGVMTAPKQESVLRHVEFVGLNSGRVLVILVHKTGCVENRIIEIDPSIKPFHLETATNYVNAHLKNHTLEHVRKLIAKGVQQDERSLDHLAHKLVAKGLALWDREKKRQHLVIKGASNLLKNVQDMEDVSTLSELLTALDTQEGLLDLLDHVIKAENIQIFIGSENPLFRANKCSAVMAPYKDEEGGVLGAVGVVGPSYMNYRRIIPMVDYTARLLGRILKE